MPDSYANQLLYSNPYLYRQTLSQASTSTGTSTSTFLYGLGAALAAIAEAAESPFATASGPVKSLAPIMLAAGASLKLLSGALDPSIESKPIGELLGKELFSAATAIAGANAALLLAQTGAFAQWVALPFILAAPPAWAPLIATGLLFSAALVGGIAVSKAGTWLFENYISPLAKINHDPLILDLDGDGIELTALGVTGQPGASNIYFDYDRDGFAERTGWVSADDGMLAFDANNNGVVDGISELFGSPSQDGYAVLETLDTNRDGVIDANDRDFAKLRVWRDLNQNGVTDAGELQTLAEAGIASISLTRSDVTGTNAGHDRGFQGNFTRANGTTGTAETIYFQTDRRTTQDNTPNFTPAEGVDKLPQLPGSGQIHSIAYKATNDSAFRADWTALTDNAATLAPDAFRAQFETLRSQIHRH